MGGGLRKQACSWRFLVGMFAVSVAVLAGCTSGGSDAASEVTSRVVETEPETPSTSSTTKPEPKETPSTAAALADDEAQVLELVRRFYVEARDRPDKSKGPADYPDVYSEVAVNPILGRVQDTDRDRIARGRTQISYSSLYTVSAVDVGDESASVVTCYLGRDETYESSGELAISSTDDFREATFTVVKVDGRWWISDWLISEGDDELCDPVDDWGDLPGPDAEPVLSVDAADAVAAFVAYQEGTGFFDERTQTLADIELAFEEFATRHEPFWLREFYNRYLDDETRDLVTEGWDLDVREIRLDSGAAQLLACGQGVGRLLDPGDGSLIQEETGSRWFIAYVLQDEEGIWLIEFFWKNSGQSC